MIGFKVFYFLFDIYYMFIKFLIMGWFVFGLFWVRSFELGLLIIFVCGY